MKIQYFTDGQGWIVDRITECTTQYMQSKGHSINIANYKTITGDNFISLSNSCDLVHYMNWDIIRFRDYLKDIKVPFILSVRSFRFPEWIPSLEDQCVIHTVNPELNRFFKNAHYIPDGIFDISPNEEFKVGMVYYPEAGNERYKGVDIVKQACKELNVSFHNAWEIPPEKMIDWYKSVNLIIVASEQEGMGTIVPECMALNVPVVSTECGHAKQLGCEIIQRNVQSVKEAILEHYTRPRIFPEYSWENINNKFSDLYKDVINDKKESRVC